MSEPKLSVVTVVGEMRDRMAKNLDHLLAQSALEEIEIIVIDLAPHLSPLRGADHSAVRCIPRPDISELWVATAEAVRTARGEIVAVIEDHCWPEPGWAAALIDAYRRPVAVVNYAFKDTEPSTYLSRSFLMAEYGRWMAPAKEGPITIASCNNVSYRREVLMRYDDRLAEWFKVEYMFHREIEAAGGSIWIEPRAVVAHEDWLRFSDGLRANSAMKRFHSAGIAFGGKPWSLPRRLFYAAAMVVAPPLHLWRLARSLWNRPALWGPFLTALPVSITVYCYMSVHEALGYLLGPGSSVAEFHETELSLPRK